jgi:hypothetical protein
MNFGKHRGRAVSEVPTFYLRWCIAECESLEPWLRQAIEEELERRRCQFQTGKPPPPQIDWRAVLTTWHRDLVKRWHPDRGGSHEAMVAVNDAVERLRTLVLEAVRPTSVTANR